MVAAIGLLDEGVEKLSDLKDGMILEGTVTNFGAFVDIGVHQDGLVHISALANRFVKDLHDVVKAGDIVKVKVMKVDEKRKRIGLSMRLDEAVLVKNKTTNECRKPVANQTEKPSSGRILADAFAQVKKA